MAALLAVLNFADFDRRNALLGQIDHVRVIGRCGCGCASVDLAVALTRPDPTSVGYPIPNEATVLDATGQAIGGILVFVRDAALAQLEVYDYMGEPINRFPAPDHLALHTSHSDLGFGPRGDYLRSEFNEPTACSCILNEYPRGVCR